MSDESKEDITPDITSFLQDVILSDAFLLFRKKTSVAFAVTAVKFTSHFVRYHLQDYDM